jgi:hypothetical protein
LRLRQPRVPSDDCYAFSTPYRTEIQQCDRSARDSIDHWDYCERGQPCRPDEFEPPDHQGG